MVLISMPLCTLFGSLKCFFFTEELSVIVQVFSCVVLFMQCWLQLCTRDLIN